MDQELAEAALRLQIKVDEAQAELDEKKEELRKLANGGKLRIVVEGLGKVDITEPRKGSEKIVLTIDEEKIAKVERLKDLLIKKGVAKEEVKQTSPAKASVKITPNV